jgi:hypothetical protein
MQTRRLLVTSVLVASTIPACFEDEPCPLPPTGPAIEVTVRAVATGDTLTASAFGSIRHGTHTADLRVCQRDNQDRPVTLCADGGPGIYEISVAAPAYQQWDTTGVLVPGSVDKGGG